ncbi:YncE family protein [Sphingomonas sp. PAMC 26621]|uniref:YncE family protein n=1 Tax=Sphingomonas sp. PAMC 26621 TaxID=1112213 RepID=UPI0002E78A2E|nr:hypothetical protein [Sphingomonas sp. PAMC 26621]
MKRSSLSVLAALSLAAPAAAQQVPNATPDIAISAQDRFYTSDQFSNTVSVIDPSTNALLGVIKLGDQTPANLSPLYKGQLLVHGMGFSPDRKTLAVISIGSNSVTFIDTATNAVKHTRRSSAPMAVKSGWRSAARTIFRCSTARRSSQRRALPCPMVRA